MPLTDSRPLTPGQRFLVRNKQNVSKKKPERRLTIKIHDKKGRNCYGRITSRRRGGGHKKAYRIIDFRRDKIDIPAKVQAIEYDPHRTANLALLAYADGEKRYILAPNGRAFARHAPSLAIHRLPNATPHMAEKLAIHSPRTKPKGHPSCPQK